MTSNGSPSADPNLEITVGLPIAASPQRVSGMRS